ncbi:hypothetical protein J2X69_001353 [Algoriphagus sp. 4150]|nr:hypothetical protein [Algoriphagus sp. 4150]
MLIYALEFLLQLIFMIGDIKYEGYETFYRYLSNNMYTN